MTAYEIISKIRPIELAQIIKRLLRLPRTNVSSRGLTFAVDPLSNFGGRLLLAGDYETDFTAAIEHILRPGHVFVDVGANEGWYTVIGSRAVGPSGLVIAVEPQERCWVPLLRNLILNGFLNHRLLPCAAGGDAGNIELILYPSINSEASTAVPARRLRHFPRQRAKVLTLDSIASALNLTHIDLLKVDCEGFELEVLKGADNLMRRGVVRNLIVELHPEQLSQLGISQSEVANFITDRGYCAQSHGDLIIWTKE